MFRSFLLKAIWEFLRNFAFDEQGNIPTHAFSGGDLRLKVYKNRQSGLGTIIFMYLCPR